MTNQSPYITEGSHTMNTAKLHINFGTGLENYADMSDRDGVLAYLTQRGYAALPTDEDKLRNTYETELCNHISDVAQRVMREAYPGTDIDVEWVSFDTASLAWNQDTLTPDDEDTLHELQNELVLLVERIMNHEYEEIG